MRGRMRHSTASAPAPRLVTCRGAHGGPPPKMAPDRLASEKIAIYFRSKPTMPLRVTASFIGNQSVYKIDTCEAQRLACCVPLSAESGGGCRRFNVGRSLSCCMFSMYEFTNLRIYDSAQRSYALRAPPRSSLRSGIHHTQNARETRKTAWGPRSRHLLTRHTRSEVTAGAARRV